MRQQYHIRHVGADTHVWDVNRLLRQYTALPVIAIALQHIAEVEQAYWFADTHPTTAEIIEHMRLVEAADLAYPILIDAEGKLMDGMHRVAQARQFGFGASAVGCNGSGAGRHVARGLVGAGAEEVVLHLALEVFARPLVGPVQAVLVHQHGLVASHCCQASLLTLSQMRLPSSPG